MSVDNAGHMIRHPVDIGISSFVADGNDNRGKRCKRSANPMFTG